MEDKKQRYETNGDNLVHSQKSTLYYDRGHEALYKIIDVRLLGYEWEKVWSYENTSKNDFKQKVTTTTALRAKTGVEFAQTFKVSAEISGMGMTAKAEAGLEHKTFTEEETTSSTTREEEYQVQAHSSVFLYQKVYRFQVDVWFKLDSYNQLWTVGNWQRDGVATVSSDITIHANEFALTGTALSGTGSLEPVAVKSADEKSNVKRFENCTKRCQDYLHQRGV